MTTEAAISAVDLTKGFIRTHADRFSPDAADAMRKFVKAASKADVALLTEMILTCNAFPTLAKKEG